MRHVVFWVVVLVVAAVVITERDTPIVQQLGRLLLTVGAVLAVMYGGVWIYERFRPKSSGGT